MAKPGRGAVAAAGSCLLGALLVTLDLATVGTVVAVLCGLAALIVTMREGWVAGFAGMLIVCTAGVFGSAQEYPLFGATARGIPVTQAPAQHSAAIFHFTDGQVRADLLEVVGVHNGLYSRQHLTYGQLFLVPVVPGDWNPDEPVPAWAVSDTDALARSKAAWAEPYRAGLRVASLDGQEIRDAISDAEQVYHLVSAPDAPIIRWVANPEAILRDQWGRMAQVVGVCSAFWGLVIWANRAVLGLRGQTRPTWRS